MTTPDILITGGGSGIGLALARRYHQAGHIPLLVGRRTHLLEKAAAELPGAHIHIADITSPDARAALVAKYPHITTLIHSAAIQHNGDFARQSTDAIERELATNLLAPIHLSHAYLPHLRQQPQATIVFITSALALVPKENAALYCASKAALHSLAQTLAWQLEQTNIRIIDLMPPLVDTAMTAGRGHGKISPDTVADAYWQALERGKNHIAVGKARWLGIIRRLSPALATRLLRKSP
ncbi:MAG: SDR family NAD(P)-dependent oxidoreductase [Cardiobacteriaceae bacterium]|nr:SDR family NAD(P)-dependent oxidoreductase [Cardiobacteriaceae bacterium]